MKLAIHPNGDGLHQVIVDNHLILLDLSGITGQLHDPTMRSVAWGVVARGTDQREGGIITRQDGTTQAFFDRDLLKPYLAVYRARKAELDAKPSDSPAAPAA